MKRLLASRKFRVAVLAVLGVLVAFLLADVVTSSPAVCSSCHEMELRASEWKQSAHAHVKCVSCHQEPHAWYAAPAALVDRMALLSRDVYRHSAGTFTGQVDARSKGSSPIGDDVCRQCHDPNRKPSTRYGIVIDHPKHAKRNGSCVSCHIRVGHPRPERGNALSFMGQCFTCHGSPKSPKASGSCLTCHPKDFKMEPASHKRKWREGHGRRAVVDREQCTMCHKQAFCDRCHGLEMPHPKDWASGKTGHRKIAKNNREICSRCHNEKPDLCTMCHHKGYNPRKGPWIRQHYVQVWEKGAYFCIECHGPVFCAECHVSGGRP